MAINESKRRLTRRDFLIAGGGVAAGFVAGWLTDKKTNNSRRTTQSVSVTTDTAAEVAKTYTIEGQVLYNELTSALNQSLVSQSEQSLIRVLLQNSQGILAGHMNSVGNGYVFDNLSIDLPPDTDKVLADNGATISVVTRYADRSKMNSGEKPTEVEIRIQPNSVKGLLSPEQMIQYGKGIMDVPSTIHDSDWIVESTQDITRPMANLQQVGIIYPRGDRRINLYVDALGGIDYRAFPPSEALTPTATPAKR